MNSWRFGHLVFICSEINLHIVHRTIGTTSATSKFLFKANCKKCWKKLTRWSTFDWKQIFLSFCVVVNESKMAGDNIEKMYKCYEILSEAKDKIHEVSLREWKPKVQFVSVYIIKNIFLARRRVQGINKGGEGIAQRKTLSIAVCWKVFQTFSQTGRPCYWRPAWFVWGRRRSSK